MCVFLIPLVYWGIHELGRFIYLFIAEKPIVESKLTKYIHSKEFIVLVIIFGPYFIGYLWPLSIVIALISIFICSGRYIHKKINKWRSK